MSYIHGVESFFEGNHPPTVCQRGDIGVPCAGSLEPEHAVETGTTLCAATVPSSGLEDHEGGACRSVAPRAGEELKPGTVQQDIDGVPCDVESLLKRGSPVTPSRLFVVAIRSGSLESKRGGLNQVGPTALLVVLTTVFLGRPRQDPLPFIRGDQGLSGMVSKASGHVLHVETGMMKPSPQRPQVRIVLHRGLCWGGRAKPSPGWSGVWRERASGRQVGEQGNVRVQGGVWSLLVHRPSGVRPTHPVRAGEGDDGRTRPGAFKPPQGDGGVGLTLFDLTQSQLELLLCGLRRLCPDQNTLFGGQVS